MYALGLRVCGFGSLMLYGVAVGVHWGVEGFGAA